MKGKISDHVEILFYLLFFYFHLFPKLLISNVYLLFFNSLIMTMNFLMKISENIYLASLLPEIWLRLGQGGLWYFQALGPAVLSFHLSCSLSHRVK